MKKYWWIVVIGGLLLISLLIWRGCSAGYFPSTL